MEDGPARRLGRFPSARAAAARAASRSRGEAGRGGDGPGGDGAACWDPQSEEDIERFTQKCPNANDNCIVDMMADWFPRGHHQVLKNY